MQREDEQAWYECAGARARGSSQEVTILLGTGIREFVLMLHNHDAHEEGRELVGRD